MGRYINWDDVINRYMDMSKAGDSTSVDSAYINHAEWELDARLGNRFTVPFSSNNETAKDLAIDIAYLKAATNRSKNWERLKTWVDERINMLLDGTMVMMTSSGVVNTGDKAVPWSSTSGSNVVFMNPTSGEIAYGLDIMPTSEHLHYP